jgi:hypothetical protein
MPRAPRSWLVAEGITSPQLPLRPRPRWSSSALGAAPAGSDGRSFVRPRSLGSRPEVDTRWSAPVLQPRLRGTPHGAYIYVGGGGWRRCAAACGRRRVRARLIERRHHHGVRETWICSHRMPSTPGIDGHARVTTCMGWGPPLPVLSTFDPDGRCAVTNESTVEESSGTVQLLRWTALLSAPVSSSVCGATPAGSRRSHELPAPASLRARPRAAVPPAARPPAGATGRSWQRRTSRNEQRG